MSTNDLGYTGYLGPEGTIQRKPLTSAETTRLIREGAGWSVHLLDRMAKDDEIHYLWWQQQKLQQQSQPDQVSRPDTGCHFPVPVTLPVGLSGCTSTSAQSEDVPDEHADTRGVISPRVQPYFYDGHLVKRPYDKYEVQIQRIVGELRSPLIFSDHRRRAGLYKLLEQFLSAPFPDIEATKPLRRGPSVRPVGSTSQTPDLTNRSSENEPDDTAEKVTVHRSNGGEQ